MYLNIVSLHEDSGMSVKRVQNFTEDEKAYLIQLVQIYPEVNLKGYHTTCLEKKAYAWNKIFEQFVSHFPTQPKRDLKQIQGCWKRMKEKVKEKSRKSVNDSGQEDLKKENGLVPRSRSPSPISLAVADLIKQSLGSLNSAEQMQIKNPFDDSAEPRDDAALGCVAQDSHEPPVESCPDSEPPTHPPKSSYCFPVGSGKRKRGRPPADEYLMMARKEHNIRMRIHQLQEWKLRNECLERGYGLPKDLEHQHPH